VSDTDDIEWVLLRSFPTQAEAQLLGELLEQQSIRVSVEGSFAAGVLPGVTEARVMVPKDRLAEADEAAKAYEGDATPTPG